MGRLPDLAPGERPAAVAAVVVAVLVVLAGLLALKTYADTGRPHRTTRSDTRQGGGADRPTTATPSADPAAVRGVSASPSAP